MKSVHLSPIDVTFADHRYTIDQLVNDVYRSKISPEIRDYIIDNVGIDSVYKARDLFEKPPAESESIVDMYVKSAESSLSRADRSPSDVGQVITINDNYQQMDPSPSVELVPRLSLKSSVRAENMQGTACSSLSQGLRSSYANGVLPNSGDGTLLLVGSCYTDWFLPNLESMDRENPISRRDDKRFHNLMYFLMFSDSVASTYVSNSRPSLDYSIEVDFDMMSTRKDTSPDAHTKATAKYVRKDGMLSMDLKVDPKRLRESCANLSSENVKYLRENFPSQYAASKVANLHTAGKNFMRSVAERCEIDPKKTELSHRVLSECGNTGAVSSLQLMKESVERKMLSKGDYGLMVDYGWEGADAFIYRMN